MCVAPRSAHAQPTARRRSTIVEDQLRKHKKSFQSFAAFVGLLLLLRIIPTSKFLDKLTNPLNLSREYYWVRLGPEMSRIAVCWIISCHCSIRDSNKMMMYRINTGNRGLVKLEWIDYLFLCINSVVERQFTCHVIDSAVAINFAWRLSDLGMLNTLPALYLPFATRRRLLRAVTFADAPPLVFIRMSTSTTIDNNCRSGAMWTPATSTPSSRCLVYRVCISDWSLWVIQRISMLVQFSRTSSHMRLSYAPEPHGLRRPV